MLYLTTYLDGDSLPRHHDEHRWSDAEQLVIGTLHFDGDYLRPRICDLEGSLVIISELHFVNWVQFQLRCRRGRTKVLLLRTRKITGLSYLRVLRATVQMWASFATFDARFSSEQM